MANSESELFSPEEMQNPFDAIRESDATDHLKQLNESSEVQLSAAIKKILIPSDNCDEQGVLMCNPDVILENSNSYRQTNELQELR